MPQAKKHSAAEALINAAAGWLVGYIANLTVLPAYGYNVSYGDAAEISVAFMGISIIRSYLLRRLFNSIT